MLDFLRRGGAASELSPKETVRKTLRLMAENGRFERLAKIADTEPPRVRAMLGAIGQYLGKSPSALGKLRASINPLSRFSFGLLAGLPHARSWQAGAWPMRLAIPVKITAPVELDKYGNFK